MKDIIYTNDRIKDRFASKIGPAQAEVKAFIAEHGDKSLGEITVAQVYQGMRGMTALICETSKLTPMKAFALGATAFQNFRSFCQNTQAVKSPCRRRCFI